MSAELDRVLEVLDAGLQRSSEVGADGGNPAKCWRCKVYDPAEGSSSGLCELCRAFLLEEGPDPLRKDGLLAYIDAELFEALQTRLLEGDGTGHLEGILADSARLSAALENLRYALEEALRPIVEALSEWIRSIDWSSIRRLVEDVDEARREHLARRTLPPGARGRGRPTAPPRDLRATEGPRPLPRPRRKTP